MMNPPGMMMPPPSLMPPPAGDMRRPHPSLMPPRPILFAGNTFIVLQNSQLLLHSPESSISGNTQGGKKAFSSADVIAPACVEEPSNSGKVEELWLFTIEETPKNEEAPETDAASEAKAVDAPESLRSLNVLA